MSELLREIERFIDDETSGRFESLLLASFQRQFEKNEPYRRYCMRSGYDPSAVMSWRDIPAAPAAAFKAFDLSCAPTGDRAAVFHSSGTTAALAGKHWMDADALRIYESSLTAGWRSINSPSRIWAVMPPPEIAPHSSLTHMLATLDAEAWFWDDWGALAARLDSITESGGEPLTLFGTGFAFVALFDASPTRLWRLPEGSLVVNTGGFKGRTREVARDEFYSSLRQRFGLGDKGCIAEYGMSEMASQFYAVGEEGVFKAPHWARTLVIDPETGREAPEGVEGLLRHFDLANWNSVAVIQTQDVGIACEGGFRLVGRAPDADVRGCSLTVEELWNRQA